MNNIKNRPQLANRDPVAIVFKKHGIHSHHSKLLFMSLRLKNNEMGTPSIHQ